MIIRHHEYEKVTVLTPEGRTLFASRHSTLRLHDRCVHVSVYNRRGGHDHAWTALCTEVVGLSPWWVEMKVRAAINDGLVDATLYALVVDDGMVPHTWPQGAR